MGARTATDITCTVARYYDLSSKSDCGDIRLNIMISHTPNSITCLFRVIAEISVLKHHTETHITQYTS